MSPGSVPTGSAGSPAGGGGGAGAGGGRAGGGAATAALGSMTNDLRARTVAPQPVSRTFTSMACGRPSRSAAVASTTST